jgi:hypothetical protein
VNQPPPASKTAPPLNATFTVCYWFLLLLSSFSGLPFDLVGGELASNDNN